ncbi:hypothetical protein ACP70R_042877 [Stipagrostis hirtigluma subsp. patula]
MAASRARVELPGTLVLMLLLLLPPFLLAGFPAAAGARPGDELAPSNCGNKLAVAAIRREEHEGYRRLAAVEPAQRRSRRALQMMHNHNPGTMILRSPLLMDTDTRPLPKSEYNCTRRVKPGRTNHMCP